MTHKDKVTNMLRDNEKLRDSDLYLYFAYVQEHYNFLLTPEQKARLRDLPTFETIVRIRRELRSIYPGRKEVEQGRFKKYQEYVNEYGEKVMRIV